MARVTQPTIDNGTGRQAGTGSYTAYKQSKTETPKPTPTPTPTPAPTQSYSAPSYSAPSYSNESDDIIKKIKALLKEQQ